MLRRLCLVSDDTEDRIIFSSEQWSWFVKCVDRYMTANRVNKAMVRDKHVNDVKQYNDFFKNSIKYNNQFVELCMWPTANREELAAVERSGKVYESLMNYVSNVDYGFLFRFCSALFHTKQLVCLHFILTWCDI